MPLAISLLKGARFEINVFQSVVIIALHDLMFSAKPIKNDTSKNISLNRELENGEREIGETGNGD